MIVKLLTEQCLEFLSLKGGYRGLSESTLVKMSNCWKSHATAHFHCFFTILENSPAGYAKALRRRPSGLFHGNCPYGY